MQAPLVVDLKKIVQALKLLSGLAFGIFEVTGGACIFWICFQTYIL